MIIPNINLAEGQASFIKDNPQFTSMEFRIGITKKLIENLGPNFSDLSVKQVNQTVDVKEDLYIQTRLSYGGVS